MTNPAIDELLEQIRDEPIQIGHTQDGGTAWWCHLCKTGHAANTGNQAVDEHACGIAAVSHALGPDHEARKILDRA